MGLRDERQPGDATRHLFRATGCELSAERPIQAISKRRIVFLTPGRSIVRSARRIGLTSHVLLMLLAARARGWRSSEL